MKRFYLIRHGHPDFPLGAHVCLGRTDLPLGPLGRMQACLLGEAFGPQAPEDVFSSPLRRCRETAAPLGKPLRLVDELAEQDMGVWDGLDFRQIREGWPTLYAARADDPLLVPPGAETLKQVQRRVVPAACACAEESRGDLVLTAHASVIQALLASAMGLPLEKSRPLRPPYASVTRLCYDGQLHLEAPAALPSLPLTPELAEKLLTAADPGERVAAHSRAVAAEALRLAEALPLPLDRALLCSAALLHDVARAEPRHAALGAAWLRELGFGEAAALVERHHDLDFQEIDEAAILYLADKCVREDRRVSLEERFARSGERCQTEEAKAAHARRLETARHIRDEVNALCGRTVAE